MSKIALSPDDSGTGTFTLASPNSNTNRTLTLPDSAGELLTTTGDGSGLTGIATAAQGALAATALQSSSSLTAANLTGALPAISGAALTSLNSASLSGALPAIDGSALTGVGGSTTYGDVGTYVFGRRSGSASAQGVFTAGSTYAGSTLYPAGISGNSATAALYWATSVSTLYSGNTGSAALSGTWRAMGSTSVASAASENPVTLFVRIS